MKGKSIWLEIVTLGTAIACLVALLIASLGTAAGAFAFAAENASSTQAGEPPEAQQTFEGMITDTRCGAKHEPAIARSASDCVRACVHSGEKFALVVGNNTYVLEGDLLRLKRLAGQRARIVGTRNGDTITVSSVASAL
jgi:hypothetical protein